MKYILLFLIRIYQKTLSYDHVFPNNRPCKFAPSCSEYGYQAIDKYGAFKGTKMAIQRVARCTPNAQPGQYDPVP
ncbi:MAG: hypothetical protein US23_C0019G0006 [candidate division WS6 bacterium GW2011_GWE1_36_69]|nr:MAG: hypothetical protein US23_C0019G0006 [candidate division WS6 bacterium GW2011_GWE1_36_69]